MAVIIKPVYAGVASYTFSGLATLANAGIVASSAVDNTSTLYDDFLAEAVATVGTVAGNKQYLVYVVSSIDGTNYGDITLEANLRLLGAVSATTNATAFRSQAFSIAAAYGGVCPPYHKLVIKNDSGVAFTAGTAQYNGIQWNMI